MSCTIAQPYIAKQGFIMECMCCLQLTEGSSKGNTSHHIQLGMKLYNSSVDELAHNNKQQISQVGILSVPSVTLYCSYIAREKIYQISQTEHH